MIVPMLRFTLVCLAGESDAALAMLTAFGAAQADFGEAGREAREAGTALALARARLEKAERLLTDLAQWAGKTTEAAASRDELSWDDVDAGLALLDRRGEQQARLETLERAVARYRPFGDFDPEELRALWAEGVDVRLYRLPPGRELPRAVDALVRVLGEDADGQAVAVFSIGRADLEGGIAIEPPERPTRALVAEAERLASQLAAMEQDLRVLAGQGETIRGLARQAAREAKRLERITAMQAAGALGGEGANLAALEGWVPVPQADGLSQAAERHGYALRLRPPAPDEEPPVLLAPPRWARPILPLLRFLGIAPGYRELDASPAVLVFLTIFFAILIGDAGYGLLILLFGLALPRLAPRLPRDLGRLLALMGAATVVWGVLTGTLFGPRALPGPLARIPLDVLTGPDADAAMMRLCFLLGAAQLTLAHCWRLALALPRPAALAQAGWIGIVWTMFFTARAFILDAPFPPIVLWLFVASVGLVLLFSVPPRELKSRWTELAMLPLTVISNFVDLVSYVRLFAVAAASVAVASAANDMAARLGAGPFAAQALAVVVLVAGHGLNILLGSMAILVHGVRLNALEFATHLGVSWAGRRFEPLGAEEELGGGGR